MTISRRLTATALGLLLASTSFAHGPQIQVTNTNGKIVTRELFLDGSYATLTNPKSVYVMPILESNGSYFSRPNDAESAPGIPQYYSGPGLAYGLNQTFAPSTTLSMAFTDGLKIYDGANFVDPGDEQIRAFRGSFAAPSAVAVTTDVGPFAGIEIALPAAYNDEAHSSIRFVLLGDGTDPLAASDDGIYLVSLQLSSSESTVLASDPYHFVLYKNVPLADAVAAANSLGFEADAIQVVPETSSILLGLAGSACCVATWMRKRKARATTSA